MRNSGSRCGCADRTTTEQARFAVVLPFLQYLPSALPTIACPLMTQSSNAPDTNISDAGLPTPEDHARALGADLVKQEGSVFLRFAGTVEAAGRQVPYALVPGKGVLAKPAKWRRMAPDEQLRLIAERATPHATDELRRQVIDFVGRLDARAADAGL